DTGSTFTFISVPRGSKDPVRDAGVLELGGCSRSVFGRPFEADGARGLPGIGFFGVEELLVTPVASLDLSKNALLTRAYEAPSDVGRGLPTSFEIVNGSILVDVVLDQKPVRLLLDTGSPDILWLGQGKQPGDVEEHTQDANGADLVIYVGTV